MADFNKAWLDDQIAFHGPKSDDGVAAACVKDRIEELEAENEQLRELTGLPEKLRLHDRTTSWDGPFEIHTLRFEAPPLDNSGQDQ